MALSSEFQDQVQTIGKLILYKNALIFENTAYQVSNISSLWVADHSYTIKHKFPAWIWITTLLGFAVVLSSLQPVKYFGIVTGCVLLGAAVYGFRKFKPETPISNFAVGIELNSGRRSLFIAPDKIFVQKAATALLDSLSERHNSAEKTVINFADKRIYVDKAEKSIIIGGDVSESLVENI